MRRRLSRRMHGSTARRLDPVRGGRLGNNGSRSTRRRKKSLLRRWDPPRPGTCRSRMPPESTYCKSSSQSLQCIARCERLAPASKLSDLWEWRMNEVVITAAVRTAVGKFGGSLAKISAADLGAHVIKSLLARSGVQPEQISEVIMGQVLTAGVGQNPARQALIRAGLPDGVPGVTVGKVCGSGLKATHLAAQAIKCGDAEIVIAGGQESMSSAPHVLEGSRDGFRLGDAKLIDSMVHDGLWDIYNN